ncbi:MAG TPA: DUF2155 domain-containing protein [Xanthobacteraceae bacterium]|nr:DUF2155 domain-containing protein [Xanthobacteraceae bacterium]
MGRFCRSVALVVAGLAAGLAPAAAQFGGIFGDPPRPPSNVPSRPPVDDRFIDQRRPMRQYPAPAYPAPQYPEPMPDTAAVAPGGAPAPAPGGIQSQTLPPPPGAPAAPPPAPTAALPGSPPGSAAAPAQPGGAPSPADAPPSEEVVIAPPAQKIANPTAVFSGLDKITGRITSFEVAINETVQFGALQVTPRVCYTRPPTEMASTDSFVEVAEVTLQGEVKRIFTGWMFAASPGLHAVEHPIYDVWLNGCKGGAPPAPVAEAQPASRTPARQPSRTPARQPAPPRMYAPPPPPR